MSSPQVDWFAQNAPKRSVPSGGDWFAANAPKEPGNSGDAKPQEGFMSSAAHGAGIPASVDEAKGMVADRSGKAPGSIAQGAYNLATNIGTGVARGAQSYVRNTGEAVRNIREGGPVLANIGKAVSGYIDMLGSVNPVVSAGGKAGEQVSEGNYRGAAGSLTGGMIAGAAMGAGIEKPTSVVRKKPSAATVEVAPTRGRALTAALNSDVEASVKKAGAALDDIAENGNPQSLKELKNALQGKSRELEGKFKAALTPYAQESVPLDAIGKAVESKITPALRKFNPELVDKITERSAKYTGQTATLEELNGLRDHLNAELKSQYTKDGLKLSEAKRDPHYAPRFAEVDAVRDVLYDKLAELNPDLDVRALKNQQSGLLDLMGKTEKRLKQLNIADAKVEELPAKQRMVRAVEGMQVTRPASIATQAYRAAVPRMPSEVPNAQVANAMGGKKVRLSSLLKSKER